MPRTAQKIRSIHATKAENVSRKQEQARAVAAYDAMRAARPLQGPPLRRDTRTLTAGALALANDIALGVYNPGRAEVELESFCSTARDAQAGIVVVKI